MTILLKRGTGTPTTSRLTSYGEVAVDKSSGNIFIRTYSGIKVIRVSGNAS